MKFQIRRDFEPAGDQPKAISQLVAGVKKGLKHQTLFGVTGSGKTFTIANVIQEVQKPTLVIAHNKTLSAQLAQEYREFFPNNAVHYFVSYYDYYQPEAYMPVSDTYIEKEAMINEEIDRLRHASTQALLTRKDVIVVASVSCIYRIEIEGGKIKEVLHINPITREIIKRSAFDTAFDNLFLFPAKHFISNKEQSEKAFKSIKAELAVRLKELEKEGKILEAERLKRRTTYDLALIREMGYCNGIENYSRHFSGKLSGEAPDTLLSYFPNQSDGSADFLTIIDESHVSVPQICAMYAGDASRKQSLVDFGFRLPSAKDNRPLKFAEFEKRVGQVIYTSATPGEYEKEHSHTLGVGQVVEQVIRPTGLIDPVVEVRPIVSSPKFTRVTLAKIVSRGILDINSKMSKGVFDTKYPGQIKDLIVEAEKHIKKGGRVIATTLTKKMAEDLSEYLKEKGIKAEYLHSDIKTIQRIEILTEFRRGKFDVIVGVNLLREGLDLPEVTLIGILDADKEGFLRSETSLIQIIGRAARNVLGKVILYADNMTGSMQYAISETNRRRDLQIAYNKKHGITPKTIIKKIQDITDQMKSEHQKTLDELLKLDAKLFEKDPQKLIKQKEKQMESAVKILDFETAALLRDEIVELTKKLNSGK